MTFNGWTFIIGIFFLPVWFCWEMLALWLKGKGFDADTISQVMRARGYQMNSLPFFWSAMMAHWWWNWYYWKTYDSPVPAVAFWCLVAMTLAMDVWLWNTPYSTLAQPLKFYRAPMVQTMVGFIAAYALFPQGMLRGPGMRWW